MSEAKKEGLKAQEGLINRIVKKIDKIVEDLAEVQELILIAKLQGVLNDKETSGKQ